MAIYRLGNQAKADLLEITAFYLRNSDKQVTHQNIKKIRSDLLKIAETPFLAEKVEGVEDTIKRWYVFRNRYIVYFKRLGPKSIKVLGIHSTRANVLRPDEIDV